MIAKFWRLKYILIQLSFLVLVSTCGFTFFVVPAYAKSSQQLLITDSITIEEVQVPYQIQYYEEDTSMAVHEEGAYPSNTSGEYQLVSTAAGFGRHNQQVNAPINIPYGFHADTGNVDYKGSLTLVYQGVNIMKIFYARNVHKVTLDANGISQQIEYRYGQNVELLPVNRNGYTSSWLKGGVIVTSFIMPNEDVNITASFTPIDYNLYYQNLNGASNSNATNYNIETAVTLQNPGNRNGYNFTGWFDDLTGGNQVTTIAVGNTGNRILYARWEVISYTITYQNLNGASNSNATNYNIETAVTLQNPGNRNGYNFTGWFDDLTGGNQVTTIAVGNTGNRILYARWGLINYTITYVYNVINNYVTTGFTNPNPTSYNIESNITFTNLSRTYYNFMGFYDGPYDDDYTQQITGIFAGPNSWGNRNIYVYFRAYSWTISYTYTTVSESNGYVNFNYGGSTASKTYVYDKSFVHSANGFTFSASGQGSGSVDRQPTGWSAWIAGQTSGWDKFTASSSSNNINGSREGDTRYYADTDYGGSVMNGLCTPVADGGTVWFAAFWKISDLKGSGCLVEGTEVNISPTATKPIEDILLGENILVWNFRTGTYDYSPVIYIEEELVEAEIITLKFADGRELGISWSHALFSATRNKYVEINTQNAHSFVGEEFYCMGEGGLVTTLLVNVEIVKRETRVFTLVTAETYNHFANGSIAALPYVGLLNMFEFTINGSDGALAYDMVALEADVLRYGLLEYDVWEGYLNENQFVYFNAAYMGIAEAKGLITVEQIYDIITYYFAKGQVSL